jgi:hypothetical protein
MSHILDNPKEARMQSDGQPQMTKDDIEIILYHIKYKDWNLVLGEKKGTYFLQWQWVAPDAVTGSPELQYSRKWQLSVYMTRSEIVRTAHKAARAAEEHECDENFTYLGHRVYNPHTDVLKLVEACQVEDVRVGQPSVKSDA